MQENYHLLVESIENYAVYMLDATGHISTWNAGAARMKGYAADEIIGSHFAILFTPGDQQIGKPQRELERALADGKYEGEGWMARKDGTLFCASVTITPIYTDRHVGFANVTQDVTGKKESEKISRSNIILEATNKELERFTSSASHDLKEPLRKIITYSGKILKEDKAISDNGTEYLNKILAAAKRMSAMIDDIMNLSALGMQESFVSYNLKDTLAESTELLNQMMCEKKTVIHAANLPKAIIIPSQMRRLFQHVLSNAIKFAQKGVTPEITVTCEYVQKADAGDGLWPADQYLRIRFKDNGIGFNQEDAERIFNLFDRLHSRSAYEGSGLGLAICKKIASNHGGTLTAFSHAGEGAEFVLTIPA